MQTHRESMPSMHTKDVMHMSRRNLSLPTLASSQAGAPPHPAAQARHLSTTLDTCPSSAPTSTHFFTQSCPLYLQKCFKSVTCLPPCCHHPGLSLDHLLPSRSQWHLHRPAIFSTCPSILHTKAEWSFSSENWTRPLLLLEPLQRLPIALLMQP